MELIKTESAMVIILKKSNPSKNVKLKESIPRNIYNSRDRKAYEDW